MKKIPNRLSTHASVCKMCQLRGVSMETETPTHNIHKRMSDELLKQLSSYRAQLQQVQAAVSTDPDNEDLLK
ncbi:hypothetical protein AMELA_G00097970 [Ameiurus melas]|uniref:Uncharacterized protein n=1 Tax=Ameiurus melas TaxID=219545 RepID=A0A7J6ASB6_AMEME|nr:hypothetical protein AMELA_G00097970 [Ameiurus melas]